MTTDKPTGDSGNRDALKGPRHHRLGGSPNLLYKPHR